MEELAGGFGLIEAPVWDDVRGLFFSDVLNGGVFKLDGAGTVSEMVPKRRGVGGMVLHADGGLIVGGRTVAWIGPRGETEILLTPDGLPPAIGFNDLTTDAQGRIWVGSLAYRVFADTPKPGFLHRIELSGEARTVSEGVMLTNGLGVSPDGRRLYHSDSRAGHVRVYDLDAQGDAGPWRVFARLGAGATPDGLKVAADGSVWVADARGGRVAVFEPDGRHRRDLPVPRPMVTSLCFGGPELRDLYVVTGSEGGPGPNCGAIYRMGVESPGLAIAPARVAHAQAQSPAD